MTSRLWNFSAGPAMLPKEVLEQAQAELLNWRGMGLSVMELSHRSAAFEALAEEIKQDLRELLALPSHYEILFTTGGARAQFALLPMNFLQPDEVADYLITGTWSSQCYEEAKKFIRANLVASGITTRYTAVPDQAQWQLHPEAKFFHYVSNETVDGLQIHDMLSVDKPLVIDMSSDFLSKPISFDKNPIIYAGSQKNFGPAGLTVILLPKPWLELATDRPPTIYSYKSIVASKSLLNTPPTFVWYMAGLVFKWLKEQDGLTGIAVRNAKKAKLIYDCIDHSDLYTCPVVPSCRSFMNVVFDLPNEELTAAFLKEAQQHDLFALKGHKIRGGIRASIFNAMPEAGVKALVEFMEDFEKRG